MVQPTHVGSWGGAAPRAYTVGRPTHVGSWGAKTSALGSRHACRELGISNSEIPRTSTPRMQEWVVAIAATHEGVGNIHARYEGMELGNLTRRKNANKRSWLTER